MDPFGADIIHMPYLITIWGDGRYFLREILRAPSQREGQGHTSFLAIQRAE